jgi:hypothetical protein
MKNEGIGFMPEMVTSRLNTVLKQKMYAWKLGFGK